MQKENPRRFDSIDSSIYTSEATSGNSSAAAGETVAAAKSRQPGPTQLISAQTSPSQSASVQPALSQPGSPSANPAVLDWQHTSPLFPLIAPLPFFVWALYLLIPDIASQTNGLAQALKQYQALLQQIPYVADRPLLSLSLAALSIYLLVAVASYWYWYFMRYAVDKERFYFRKGVIFYKHREVPIQKIQSIETKASLLSRLLGLRTLHIESAGGNNSEVVVPYLSKGKAADLYELLQKLNSQQKRRLNPDTESLAKETLSADPLGTEFLNAETLNAVSQNATGQLLEETATPVPGYALTPPAKNSAVTAPAASSSVSAFNAAAVSSSATAFNAATTFNAEAGAAAGGYFYRVKNQLIILAYLVRIRNIFLLLFGIGQISVALIQLFLAHKSSLEISWGLSVLIVLSIYGVFISPVLAHWNTKISLHQERLRSERGLLTQVSQSTELGRIHGFSLQQSLIWRLADWWNMSLLIVGREKHGEEAKNDNDLIMPIGTIAQASEIVHRAMPTFQTALTPFLLELAEGDPGRCWNLRQTWIRIPKSRRFLSPFDGGYEGLGYTENYCIRREGLLRRKVICLPLHHAQEIALRRGPLDRLFSTASLTIYPVRGTMPPLSMSWIPVELAVSLRKEIQELMQANLRSISASRLPTGYEEESSLRPAAPTL